MTISERADFEEFDERLKEVEAHYLEDCRKDAEKRVGVSPYAYEVILFAQRLLMLARIGALEILIQRESLNLAQSLALHRFGAEA